MNLISILNTAEKIESFLGGGSTAKELSRKYLENASKFFNEESHENWEALEKAVLDKILELKK